MESVGYLANFNGYRRILGMLANQQKPVPHKKYGKKVQSSLRKRQETLFNIIVDSDIKYKEFKLVIFDVL